MSDLREALSALEADDVQAADERCTYVVDANGVLRIAARRTEHVVCAGGGEVFTAGELRFEPVDGDLRVSEATNQSTGYCPDSASYDALASTLERAGIDAPTWWTHSFEFRVCVSCGERAIVKDEWFVCEFCAEELPERYNAQDGF